jgi:cobalt-zinc-cadmium efflux system membrane fusion protein
VLTGAVLGALILRSHPRLGAEPAGERREHGDAGENEPKKGPHGGRLLVDGAFSAEVTIFERDRSSELRLYFFQDGASIDPRQVTAAVTLRRLGGLTETFAFEPQDDFLVGKGVVGEPHSFDVDVTATRGGASHRWSYASYESRVQLSRGPAERAGIVVETAGPATLATRLRLNGLIFPNEDRLAHVLPRFAGIVKDVRKHIGDPVAKGEVLAIVQSNQSLQAYDVRSEIAGNVIQKHVAPGEFVAEGDQLYTVANLDTVWVDLNVYRQDFPRLAVGQPVLVDPGEGIAPIEGRVDYISPFGAPNTQTMLARVILANPRHLLRPGFFASGDVLVDQTVVPLAVRASAVQTLGERQVVFVQEGDVYEARPVDLGRRDGEWIEVLSGLAAGERYVTANSFVLKSEVGKSAAEHHH